MLHGVWDLPGPGLKPVSPALAGGFLTTVPPGKPQVSVILNRKLFLKPEVHLSILGPFFLTLIIFFEVVFIYYCSFYGRARGTKMNK